MTTAATWLIIAGFLLMVCGLTLCTLIMMCSSDITPHHDRVLYARTLMQLHHRLFPRSATPRLMSAMPIRVAALLPAGIAVFAR